MSKIHKFIGPFVFSEKELEVNDKNIISQIHKVLKLKEGETIELGDGKNLNALVKIKTIKKDIINVEIEKTWESVNQIKNNVTLFCAILKKENFETVVQKTIEAGVLKIIPIISDRTIKTGLNMERLQKIAKEASEQSGRGSVPEILDPISFDESLKLSKEKDLNIIFDASGNSLSTIYAKTPSHNINIWIGPEGGWTNEEIEKTKKSNFKLATLGQLILRAETAAIISTYLASNL